ncbi:ExbD/TolR family protein [Mesoterricola sediminis]|uniref:Biopolymer transporter ExbD n=1 Tax=Mesoterricola sediminis TaxID=2927980 RepID=A0AA48KD68_9BACT|nr:biopolymer transporter ExbD [Mesoterricola sediminis]BDU77944.1 hypothetical protein METESE_29020 [Mesoterricola sediminis]
MDLSRARADINITPLIDIVLVLLIVFIVLVPGLVPALKVAVPQIVDGPRGLPAPPIVVSLDGEGRLFLQREAVDAATLRARVAEAVLLQPAGLRKVFLKVDAALPHQRAVDVLGELHAASDLARAATLAKVGPRGEDGGEIRVAVSLLKTSPAAL